MEICLVVRRHMLASVAVQVREQRMLQVAHGSTMFLYNMDWAMEWPRPLPPNVQLVGALLPTQAQPLPPRFQVRTAPRL